MVNEHRQAAPPQQHSARPALAASREEERGARMSAAEQHKSVKELASALARDLGHASVTTVAARDERERGLVHDAVLIAGMRLDQPVAGRQLPDGGVLVWVEDDDTVPRATRA
ncbi:hypothetical protein FHX37_3378 [Haloactinospora alba]|uniref:Uncharacterized protein n=1 Tax=Haloactinospora alba TaxID=405555 RepID=A0A543NNF8_9ACTN|nr:hypothetical protein [Haloactinospora alba]TQN33363.1 hypothetical protein FHX37_3378 [Haloactinospora alba]